jgi:WD40 repeat protein
MREQQLRLAMDLAGAIASKKDRQLRPFSARRGKLNIVFRWPPVRGNPVIVNWLRLALLPLFLLVSPLAAQAEDRGNLPVTILPNLVELSFDTRATFSSSGSQLIVFDRLGTSVWDIAAKRLVRRIAYETYAKAHVLTPDGEVMISGHMDGKIRSWSLATGAPAGLLQGKPVLRGEPDVITALAVSPDGALLVSGRETGVISVWNLKTYQKSRSFNFSAGSEAINPHLIALRLTRDMKSLIAVTISSVRTFDFGTGRQLTAFDLPNEKYKYDNSFLRDSIVSDDGLIAQFATQGCDIAELRYVDLKDPSNPTLVDKPAECHKSEDDSYEFGSPSLFVNPASSTVLIARSGLAEIREWDLKSRSATRTIKWANNAKPEMIGVDKDLGKIASDVDDHVSVHELESGSTVSAFGESFYPADAAVLSKDGRSILMAQPMPDKKRQQLTLWDVGAPDPKQVLLVPATPDTTMRDFSLQAKLAAATSSDGFVLYSIEDGKEPRRFTMKEIKSPWVIRLSPDGKLALLLGDGPDDERVTLLIDTADASVKRRFDEKKEDENKKPDDDAYRTAITDVAFSPDGKRLALGRFNGTIDLWDTNSLKRIKQLPAVGGDDADRVWSLAFTPDGKKLVSGSRDSGAFLWSIEAGRPPRAFLYDDMTAGHPYLASVALSHDGSTLIAGSSQHAVSSGDSDRERSIKVWNAATGKRRSGWRAHEGGVEVVTFSPDDRWIVSASRDGTIKYWDAETGKIAATIIVSNDGHWVVLSASGLFSGNTGDTNLFSLSRGLAARPSSDFQGQLFKPDLIAELLKGDPNHRYAAAAKGLDLKKVWDGAGQ